MISAVGNEPSIICEEVDMCKDNPTICENGGSCIQKFNSYECQCTPGFGGKRCRIPTSDCSQGNPCHHGGTCRSSPETGRVECLCPSGYRGQFCENDVDECAEDNSICGNGGACQNLVISVKLLPVVYTIIAVYNSAYS